jgi:hypothetical protein
MKLKQKRPKGSWGSRWKPEFSADVIQKNVERDALRKAGKDPSRLDDPHEMETHMVKEEDYCPHNCAMKNCL